MIAGEDATDRGVADLGDAALGQFDGDALLMPAQQAAQGHDPQLRLHADFVRTIHRARRLGQQRGQPARAVAPRPAPKRLGAPAVMLGAALGGRRCRQAVAAPVVIVAHRLQPPPHGLARRFAQAQPAHVLALGAAQAGGLPLAGDGAPPIGFRLAPRRVATLSGLAKLFVQAMGRQRRAAGLFRCGRGRGFRFHRAS